MSKELLSSGCLELLERTPQIFVGFSGGLDSTVLLDVLVHIPSLKNKISAIHINHGLAKEADEWELHCQGFCEKYDLPFLVHSVEFDRSANIEAHAREARYQAFASYINKNSVLVLAHHKNDQAETLLLNLLRGAGVEGLAAMTSQSTFAKGILLRPFLSVSRQMLEEYGHRHHLSWVIDPSNENIQFNRNFIRHQILPLMQSNWPTAVDSLTRAALHCQEAQTNLTDLAMIDCPGLSEKQKLPLNGLVQLKRARLNNVLRAWFKMNGIRLRSTMLLNRIVEEVIFSAGDSKASVDWGDITIRRYKENLYIVEKTKDLFKSASWDKFPQPLILGNKQLIAEKVDAGLYIPPNSKIEVRFRQEGERFVWHGQTKTLKKLFQQWEIPPWLRGEIPLVFINGELSAVVGFAVSDKFFSSEGEAWRLAVIS